MWLSAFFGMSTIYGEAVLAQKYKTVDKNGHVTGGPIYYIRARFTGRFGKFWPASSRWRSSLRWASPATWCRPTRSAWRLRLRSARPSRHRRDLRGGRAGFIFWAAWAVSRRSPRRSYPSWRSLRDRLHRRPVRQSRGDPPRAQVHFLAAFDPQAIWARSRHHRAGAMRYGVARGLFSSEAGMGSTRTRMRWRPGQAAGPRRDRDCLDVHRHLYCTHAHRMVILTSGRLQSGVPGWPAGTELAQAAFNVTLGSVGNAFGGVHAVLPFSTLIGWYFFGLGPTSKGVVRPEGHQRSTRRSSWVCIVIGSALQVRSTVWNLSDLFNALMVFPNLIALLFLSGIVVGGATARISEKNKPRGFPEARLPARLACYRFAVLVVRICARK